MTDRGASGHERVARPARWLIPAVAITAALLTNPATAQETQPSEPAEAGPESAAHAVRVAVAMVADGHYAQAADLLDWTRRRSEWVAEDPDRRDPAFALSAEERAVLAQAAAEFRTMGEAKHADTPAPGTPADDDGRLRLEDLDRGTQLRVRLLLKRHARLFDPEARSVDAEAAAELITDLKPVALEVSDYPRLWVLTAQLALVLDRNIDARVAARHLHRLKADTSQHPLYQSVVASLKQRELWPAPAEESQE